MPTRNVYVSDTDVPLFDRAARLAGGLSPAVAAALRLYVAQQEQAVTHHDQTIELDVADGAVSTRKSFQGRPLTTVTQRHGLRNVRYAFYATRRGQLAVYVTDKPDWSRMGGADEAAWEDPRTWSEDFYETKDKTLEVYPDLDALARALPDDVAAALRRVLDDPGVVALDL